MWHVVTIAAVLGLVTPAELEHCRQVGRLAYDELLSPPPPPGPVPDRKTCPNCKGKGKVGDGVVFTECVVCDGRGWVTEASASAGSNDSAFPNGLPLPARAYRGHWFPRRLP